MPRRTAGQWNMFSQLSDKHQQSSSRIHSRPLSLLARVKQKRVRVSCQRRLYSCLVCPRNFLIQVCLVKSSESTRHESRAQAWTAGHALGVSINPAMAETDPTVYCYLGRYISSACGRSLDGLVFTNRAPAVRGEPEDVPALNPGSTQFNTEDRKDVNRPCFAARLRPTTTGKQTC